MDEKTLKLECYEALAEVALLWRKIGKDTRAREEMLNALRVAVIKVELWNEFCNQRQEGQNDGGK